MLRAELYNYSGEVNKIQKSLGNAIYSVPFTFLDNYDLQTPHIVLTLAGNDANGKAMQAYMAFQINYIVIYDSDNAAFRKQYYFVDKVIWQTNELLEFALRKDVLMTYATSIVNLEGWVERTSNLLYQNLNIKDNYFSFENRFELIQNSKKVIDEPNPFTIVVSSIQSIYQPLEHEVVSLTLTNSGSIADYSYTKKGITPNTTISIISCPSLPQACLWLNNFSKWVQDNSESVASYIIGCWIVPFSIDTSSLYDYGVGDVLVGAIPVKDQFVGWQNVSQCHSFYFASNYTSSTNHCDSLYKDFLLTSINRNTNDFRDFEPYTKISLSIPFYGDYEINPSVLFPINSASYSIRLRYVFNFYTGESVCIVSIAQPSQDVVLDVLSCNALIPVALNSTTKETVNNQENSNSLKILASAIGGAGAAVGLTAINPVAGIISALASLGTGIANYYSSEAVNIEKGLNRGTRAGAYFSEFCSNLRIINLKIYRAKVASGFLSTLSGINNLVGRPCDQVLSINAFGSGDYIKYKIIHADIPYSTSQEKEEIERLLMSGVYK